MLREENIDKRWSQMNLELHETVLNQLYLRKGVHMIHEGSLHTTSDNHDNEQ